MESRESTSTSKPSPSLTDVPTPANQSPTHRTFINDAEAQIRAKVRMVAHDERSFGTLSTGERIAVALVLDRYDLMQHAWGSMLKAVHRLGPEWTQSALQVQRNGWLDET